MFGNSKIIKVQKSTKSSNLLIYQNGGLLRTSFLCQNYSNCEDLAQNIYRNNLCISANERKVYIYGAEGN